MLTGTSLRSNHALEFGLRAVAWSLGLFGLLRLGWIETHVVLPATVLQGGLAIQTVRRADVARRRHAGMQRRRRAGALSRRRPRLPGADGHRASPRAAGGIALILGINTLRIGTLGLAASSPGWFNALHVYVWPAILTLAIAGYVFAWMRARRSPARRVTARRASHSRHGDSSR